jgi:t-SNARE complex subunit (syntaxin)
MPFPPRPQERAEEARGIARATAELSNVVADVHGLVHTQEEAITTVEAQTTSALEKTEQGVKELEIARTYVSAYRKKWLCVILIIVLCVTVLLVLHFGTKPGTLGHI